VYITDKEIDVLYVVSDINN